MLYSPFCSNELVRVVRIEDGMSIECNGELIVYSFTSGTLEPDVDCGRDIQLASSMELYETDIKYIIMDKENKWGAELPKVHSRLVKN
ncbi:hypothetical protein [Neptuniibacter marinus]|uniref:hypothetical protein n=1 Tax=Neptuniibacter marinus TaxID=1806670 RepID=UPI0008306C9A|nr:hypothetical protein [Neptuniibacter marinus]